MKAGSAGFGSSSVIEGGVMSAFAWAVLTACIWGIVPVMEKLGLSAPVSPPAAVMVRSFGVLLGLCIFGWVWSPWQAIKSMSVTSVALLVGGGFLASVVGQIAFYQALRWGALSQVTPVAGAYPMVAAVLGWIIFREPLTAMRVLGVALIISGAALLRK
jgi:transporter family protein